MYKQIYFVQKTLQKKNFSLHKSLFYQYKRQYKIKNYNNIIHLTFDSVL